MRVTQLVRRSSDMVQSDRNLRGRGHEINTAVHALAETASNNMYNNEVPEARAIREVMLLRSRNSCYRLAVATSAVHAALIYRSIGRRA